MKIRMIPLGKLVPGSANVRKTGATTGIDELAASIEAHGLLQNLQVREGNGGKFEVVAGARRLAALRQLAKKKAIAKSAEIPCHVLEDEDAAEISLAENVVRLAMHPADQYDAFKAMADAGRGPEEIAARFGVTASVVRQRLKLASVSPRLIALYREGDMNLDQLMAFTVSDDHAAQEAAWFEQPEWNRDPAAIRRILTAAHAEADDPRAMFVGLDAYAGAGGTVLRDLFDAEHEGYLTDTALLDRLVREKLEGEAEKLRAEGWKWVEITPEIEHSDFWRCFERLEAGEVPLTPEQKEEAQTLATEYDCLIEEAGEDGEAGIADRLDAIQARLDELSALQEIWSDGDKAKAGAVVSIDHDGGLRVMRGLVRREDMVDGADGQDGEHAAPSAGSGATAAPKLLSDKLVEDLTAQRTAAMRAVLAGNADVALTATVHALALPLFYRTADAESCLALRLESPALQGSAGGIDDTPAGKMLAECASVWQQRMPEDADGLWDWLLKQSTATRLDLLAFCAGSAVNAVKKPHDNGDAGRLVHAERLASALRLDMAQWWQPTAASYLARVSKTRILEAVSEAVSPSAAENLAGMKKAALVAEAEKRLSGKGWLPPVLRVSDVSAGAENIVLQEAAE